jgi:polyisoprenoid-binding protein YceI
VPLYTIDAAASSVVVSARSNIHHTRTVWSRLTGQIQADPADLSRTPSVDVALDMTRHDAGDFLRNRKLRKDLEVDRHPEARFSLAGLGDITDRGGGRFAARAEGVIHWRNRDVSITADGEGELDAERLRATARFELDVRAFGVEPPRFLMFKVENIVGVEVTLTARAG